MDEREAQDGVTDAERDSETRPWLSSVTVGDFPGLEEDVTIDLSPRCTVLVGKNGAGKSLLFEALLAASSFSCWPRNLSKPTPGHFQCMLHFSPDIHVGYEYRLNVEEGKTQRAGAEGSARFIEHCWQEKAGARTELWRVENGVLRYASGNEVRLGPQTGLLSGEDGQGSDETSQVANALVRLLGFKIIHAGVPRAAAGDDRRDLFVRVRKSSRDPSTGLFDRINTHTDRLDKIASSIVYLYEDAITELDPPQKSFEEISSAVQRIGLAKKLDVQLYGPVPGSSRRNGEEEWIAEAKLDGVNIGRASDGTCRTLETLLHLFRPGEWLVPLLLEEPETGIHPSLLQRLLHELEAYEGQLIISTHSPQVVSWAKPEEIRIVERRDGKTTVRPLAPSQVESVHGYLADDGTLGEFVYGGALDDEV